MKRNDGLVLAIVLALHGFILQLSGQVTAGVLLELAALGVLRGKF